LAASERFEPSHLFASVSQNFLFKARRNKESSLPSEGLDFRLQSYDLTVSFGPKQHAKHASDFEAGVLGGAASVSLVQ
jgi:hypothetical protein